MPYGGQRIVIRRKSYIIWGRYNSERGKVPEEERKKYPGEKSKIKYPGSRSKNIHPGE